MSVQEMPMPMRDAFGAALRRVIQSELFDGRPDPDAIASAQSTLRDATETLGGEEPDRYLALYGELVVVGALARARYGEERLSRDELRDFNDHLARFLNSWVHRHGHG